MKEPETAQCNHLTPIPRFADSLRSSTSHLLILRRSKLRGRRVVVVVVVVRGMEAVVDVVVCVGARWVEGPDVVDGKGRVRAGWALVVIRRRGGA